MPLPLPARQVFASMPLRARASEMFWNFSAVRGVRLCGGREAAIRPQPGSLRRLPQHLLLARPRVRRRDPLSWPRYAASPQVCMHALCAGAYVLLVYFNGVQTRLLCAEARPGPFRAGRSGHMEHYTFVFFLITGLIIAGSPCL
jgi:hypothetical protein